MKSRDGICNENTKICICGNRLKKMSSHINGAQTRVPLQIETNCLTQSRETASYLNNKQSQGVSATADKGLKSHVNVPFSLIMKTCASGRGDESELKDNSATQLLPINL
jgi:hypothetical protein